MFPGRPEEFADKPSATVGAAVTTPDGKRYWFPGGSAYHAAILYKATLPAEVLADPKTRIEYGTRDGAVWRVQQLIKVPPGG